MAGLLRLLLFAILLWLLIAAVRRLFLLASSSQHDQVGEKGQKTLPLVQDPECGRFVVKRDAVQASFHGQQLLFCSRECRDRYLSK